MVCVSIQEKDFCKCKEILAKCEMAEIRGDLCQFPVKELEELVQLHPNVLYTHRIAGSNVQEAMEHMVAAMKKGVKYVDIEIEAPVDYLEMIKSYARANGCRLIISYHDFNGTPSFDELCQIYDLCRRKGADIVKIVTTAHSVSDAARVMQLYKYNRSDRELETSHFMEHGEDSGSLSNSFGTEQAKLVAFCMGEAGKFTRLLCLDSGAPYTYAALDASVATAPGQYTKAEMERLLNPNNYPYPAYKLEDTIFCKHNAVTIPCSKSVAQRAILAAALAEGRSVLDNFEPCNDILGAVEAIKALGAKATVNGNTLTIESNGVSSFKGISRIFVGESGLLTRLLVPMAAYLAQGGKEIEITGCGSILTRNLGESAKAIEVAGAKCCSNGGFLPFRISVPQDGDTAGKQLKNNISFSGKESSQIVSGFLMMLPLLEEDSTLTITNPASIPYLQLTLRVLSRFGININVESNLPHSLTFHIKGNQKYRATSLRIDSDWSSAANFAVGGALANGITLLGMPLDSAQADEYVLELLKKFGVSVEKVERGEVYDIKIHPLSGNKNDANIPERVISLHHCPDLFPIAATLAGNCNGTTVLEGTERLGQKESNRAQTVYGELFRLGYNIDIHNNRMYICGKTAKLQDNAGQSVLCQSHNDHRIAMAIYIAALFDSREIKLDNIKCIDKSFPSFMERLAVKY